MNQGFSDYGIITHLKWNPFCDFWVKWGTYIVFYDRNYWKLYCLYLRRQNWLLMNTILILCLLPVHLVTAIRPLFSPSSSELSVTPLLLWTYYPNALRQSSTGLSCAVLQRESQSSQEEGEGTLCWLVSDHWPTLSSTSSLVWCYRQSCPVPHHYTTSTRLHH